MTNPIISVAICTFNGELYIEEQLDSIIKQSMLPDEIVICDDCSTDKTVKVIEQYTKQHDTPHIQLIKNQENLGYVRNFEQCIGLCRGEYIFLSDQDDVWLSKKIETVYKFFNLNQEIDMVFTDALLVDEHLISLNKSMFDTLDLNREEWKNLEFNQLFKKLLKHYLVTGATICIKKKQIKNVLPIPINSYQIHDGWMGLITSYQNKLGYINESLIKYRQHSRQSIGAKPKHVPVPDSKNRIAFFIDILNNTYYYKNLIQNLYPLIEVNRLLLVTIDLKSLNTKSTEKNYKFLSRQKRYLDYLQNLPKNRIVRLFTSLRYQRNLLPFTNSFRSCASFLFIELLMKVPDGKS